MSAPFSQLETQETSVETAAVEKIAATPKKNRRRNVITALAVLAIVSATPAKAGLLPGGLSSIPGLGGITNTINSVTGTIGSVTSALGGLGGVTDEIQQVLSPIQGYLQQIQNITSGMDGFLDKILGSVMGDLLNQIKGALGDLNIPDPQALLDELLKKDDGSVKDADKNAIGGLVPIIIKDNAGSTIAAKVFAQQSLGKEAQTQAKQELEQASQAAQASGQAAQATGQAGQAATQAAQTASQSAQQAQSRVSTQDALKDLNTVSASIASGIAAQSGQLTSISGQLGQDAQIQAIQTAKLSQIATGQAIAVQQLADVNGNLRGQQQAELMKDVATSDRLNRLTAGGFGFMR